MSKATERFQTIFKKIEFIEKICTESGSITKALEDEIHSRASIMMHLTSIAEQFDKLAKEGEFEFLSRFDKHDLKGSYDVRNYIAHDYEGVNLAIIETVIKDKLPKIKAVLLGILKK